MELAIVRGKEIIRRCAVISNGGDSGRSIAGQVLAAAWCGDGNLGCSKGSLNNTLVLLLHLLVPLERPHRHHRPCLRSKGPQHQQLYHLVGRRSEPFSGAALRTLSQFGLYYNCYNAVTFFFFFLTGDWWLPFILLVHSWRSTHLTLNPKVAEGRPWLRLILHICRHRRLLAHAAPWNFF